MTGHGIQGCKRDLTCSEIFSGTVGLRSLWRGLGAKGLNKRYKCFQGELRGNP